MRRIMFVMLLTLLAFASSASADIVFGTITPDGTVQAGAGFSAIRSGCGQYTVTYDIAFPAPPVVTVSPRRAAPGTEGGVQIGVTSADQGGFSVFANQPIRRAFAGTWLFTVPNVGPIGSIGAISPDGLLPLPFGGTFNGTPFLNPRIVIGTGTLLQQGGVLEFRAAGPDGQPGPTFTYIIPAVTDDFCLDVQWDFIAIGP